MQLCRTNSASVQDCHSCVFCEELYNHAGAYVREPCRCQGEEEARQECVTCKGTETGVHLARSRHRVVGDTREVSRSQLL